MRQLAKDNDITYDFDPNAIAEDAFHVINFYLGSQGRESAEAFAKGRDFYRQFSDANDITVKALSNTSDHLQTYDALGFDKFMDIVPFVVEDVLTAPSDPLRIHLQRYADAYLLLFFLRENPDIQKVMAKVFQMGVLLVDTSFIVPALAETALPTEQQRLTGLLKAAKAAGMHLYVNDDVLNELKTHLRRLQYAYLTYIEPSLRDRGPNQLEVGSQVLVKAYLTVKANNRDLSFATFLYRFMGETDPKQDLIETLREYFGIEYRAFEDEYKDLDQILIANVMEVWMARKKA